MVRKICDKGILMKDGKIDDYDDINSIIEKYIDNYG
jgi:ABC-type polysaccharide/polyol phosphate transport system ATPase subunit